MVSHKLASDKQEDTVEEYEIPASVIVSKSMYEKKEKETKREAMMSEALKDVREKSMKI